MAVVDGYRAWNVASRVIAAPDLGNEPWVNGYVAGAEVRLGMGR